MLRLFPRPSSRPRPPRLRGPPCYSSRACYSTSTTHHAPRQDSSSNSEPASSESVDSKTPSPEIHSPSQPSQPSQETQPIPPNDAAEPKGTPIGAVDVDKMKEKLRIWAEDTAVALRGRADQYTSAAIKTFAQVGRELNKVTGYQEIEALKRAVAEQEARINTSRSTARTAKLEYERAVHARAKSQREVNDLLQRKSSWTDDDVSRFTSLVRQDHLFEQAEHRAKQHAEHTEGEVEREFSELMKVILNRYHEEQVWSDKIRSASTYGQLTVLGLNMLVFLLAIVLVEPWKRKRLAQTFERKVDEMAETTAETFKEQTRKLVEQLEKQEKELGVLREVVTYSLQPSATVLEEAGATVVGDADVTASIDEGVTKAQTGHRKGTETLYSQPRYAWTVTAAASATAGLLGALAGYYLSQ